MKKIAVITTGLAQIFADKKCGGGEILFKNLLLELINMPDINLYIFTPDEKDIIQKVKEDYPNVNICTYNSSPFEFSYVNELNKIFKVNSFDKIINSNMFVPYKTTILQSHSFIYRLNKVNKLLRSIKNHFMAHRIKMQKVVFERAKNDSDYIAVSNIIKKDYTQNYNIPAEKITVIYPGVKINEFEEITKKDKITFGIVANSSINKGGHYLLLALGILKLFFLKYNLKIIAPKYDKDILMRLIINLFFMKKHVEVLPHQDDMTKFYKNIDALVLPSINEAFGLVVLEAMERGKPCLVSSTAGSSEIITKENGFIFNRNSFYDFLKKLYKLTNLYNTNFEIFKNFSKEARITAEKYSWKSFACKVIDADE